MKKVFTNDRFFLAVTLCAVIGCAAYLLSLLSLSLTDYFVTQIPTLIRALCVIFLYSSYKKHSKNVMKGLMGALLMVQLITAISTLSALYQPGEGIFAGIYLAVSLLLFINHFIINSDHHSKPGMIKLNQYLCVAYLLDIVAWNILWIVADQSVLNIICCFFDVIYIVGMASSIVCVESRLDAYRIEREAKGYVAK